MWYSKFYLLSACTCIFGETHFKLTLSVKHMHLTWLLGIIAGQVSFMVITIWMPELRKILQCDQERVLR